MKHMQRSLAIVGSCLVYGLAWAQPDGDQTTSNGNGQTFLAPDANVVDLLGNPVNPVNFTVGTTGSGFSTLRSRGDQLPVLDQWSPVFPNLMYSTFRTDIGTGNNQCWNMVRNNVEIGRLFHGANTAFQIQVSQPAGALWLRNSSNGAFRLNPDGNTTVGGYTINSVGFGSLGSQNPGINTFNPWARWSLMHQNMGTAQQISDIQTCFRPWFGNAMLGMGNPQFARVLGVRELG